MYTTSDDSAQRTGRQAAFPPALLIGDVLALLVFVVVGRLSHGFTGDWLSNVVRIAAPFLIGWFVAAFPLGAYRPDLLHRPGLLLLRTAPAWLVGNGLAFALRAFLFQDNVTLPFALTSMAFTGLFLLGWRAVYLWWINR